MTARLRLPDPVDPAAPPWRLARVAAAVLIGGLLMGIVGAVAMAPGSGRGEEPSALAQALFLAWFASLPVGGPLLLAYRAIGRRRLRRFERRAGFLPRRRRLGLPATGRTTLYRVEYGQRGARVCLMLARWDHHRLDGWRRTEVVQHAWHPAEDAVALGTERARLTAVAEQLEEEADDARLAAQRDRRLVTERLAERAAARERAARLVEQLARDSR